jgi:hypothetical protein
VPVIHSLNAHQQEASGASQLLQEAVATALTRVLCALHHNSITVIHKANAQLLVATGATITVRVHLAAEQQPQHQRQTHAASIHRYLQADVIAAATLILADIVAQLAGRHQAIGHLHLVRQQPQHIQHSAHLRKYIIAMIRLLAQVQVHNGAELTAAHRVLSALLPRNIIVTRKALALAQAVNGARQQVRLPATALTRAQRAHQHSHGIATQKVIVRAQAATGAIHIAQQQHARHPAAMQCASQAKPQHRALLTAVRRARVRTTRSAAAMARHMAMNAKPKQLAFL